MALLSAVMAFVVVGIGEATAHSRKSSGERTKADQTRVVSLADASTEIQAVSPRSIRVVYPAVVVAR
jgi:hypothetical protein